jgi:hypothetical protein
LIFVPVSWLTNIGASPEESVVEARTLVALEPASNPNLGRALDFIEQGNYREAAEILINLYTSASFVNKFERATSDQFPFRMPIIQFSKALDRQIIKIAYSFLKDSAIPADMTSDIYYDRTNNQLVFSPNLFDEAAREAIDERINNYEDIIQSHPDKNFYLYYHQTLENSEFHPLSASFTYSDKSQSIGYFEENLPENLIVKKFMLEGMEDHLENYYRTDHHWNVNGILKAYGDIHDMLASNYPGISPMLEHKDIIKFPDIEFLGLMARRTFYPIKGDDFAVEIVDFPTYEMKVNDQLIEQNQRQTYFEGNYSNVPYTNHYNEFYGYVTNYTEYTFENDSNRNLLFIGSSYRYALDPLVASHYKKTYCVDLRYFTDFSLSEFLAEHEVDDILIIGDNDVAFEDLEYWKINP